MTDPFVAEIRILALNFAPKGWALCDGQIMPLSQNTALFSLLGTMYGGDGRSTFALPDLQGAAPVHPDGYAGPFPSTGASGGSQTVTLIESEIPGHTHSLNASGGPANLQSPGTTRAVGRTTVPSFAAVAAPETVMAPQALAPAGGSLPHNNMMPFLTLTFAIALQGVFPPRG